MAKLAWENCRLTVWTTGKMEDGDRYTLRVENNGEVLWEENSEIDWRYMVNELANWKHRLAEQVHEQLNRRIAADDIIREVLSKGEDQVA